MTTVVLVGQRVSLPWMFESADRAGVSIVLVPRFDEKIDTANLPSSVVEVLPLDIYRDPEGSVAKLVERHAQQPFAGIVSGCDPAVPFVAKAAQALGLHGLPEDVAHLVRDKRRMRDELRDAGLNTPRHVNLTDPADWLVAADLTFPVVVKPASGYASFGVTKVDNPARLERVVADVWAQCEVELDPYSKNATELLGLVVEEYLDGPEFSVESLTHNGETRILTVSDKGQPTGPYFEEIGFRSPAELPDDARIEIERQVLAAHKAFGVTTGATHTEVRLHNGRPHLLEMGARIGGGGLCHQVVRTVTGVDFAAEVFRLAIGETPACWDEPVRQVAHAGCYMAHFGGSGRITAVHGVAELHDDPRVDYAVQMLFPGDIVRPYPDWSGYPVWVFSHHDSDAEVAEFHEHLDRTIRLDFEEVQ